MIPAERNRRLHSRGRREAIPARFIAAILATIICTVGTLGAISAANAQVIGQSASAVTDRRRPRKESGQKQSTYHIAT